MYARAVVARTSLSLAEARTLATCWGLAVDGIAAIDAGTLNSSYVLASGEIFWGQDRLDFLERALAKPAA